MNLADSEGRWQSGEVTEEQEEPPRMRAALKHRPQRAAVGVKEDSAASPTITTSPHLRKIHCKGGPLLLRGQPSSSSRANRWSSSGEQRFQEETLDCLPRRPTHGGPKDTGSSNNKHALQAEDNKDSPARRRPPRRKISDLTLDSSFPIEDILLLDESDDDDDDDDDCEDEVQQQEPENSQEEEEKDPSVPPPASRRTAPAPTHAPPRKTLTRTVSIQSNSRPPLPLSFSRPQRGHHHHSSDDAMMTASPSLRSPATAPPARGTNPQCRGVTRSRSEMVGSSAAVHYGMLWAMSQSLRHVVDGDDDDGQLHNTRRSNTSPTTKTLPAPSSMIMMTPTTKVKPIRCLSSFAVEQGHQQQHKASMSGCLMKKEGTTAGAASSIVTTVEKAVVPLHSRREAMVYLKQLSSVVDDDSVAELLVDDDDGKKEEEGNEQEPSVAAALVPRPSRQAAMMHLRQLSEASLRSIESLLSAEGE